MVFNVTFNNISVISLHSVLLVEETGVPGENYRQILSHNAVSSTRRHEWASNSLPYDHDHNGPYELGQTSPT